MVRLLKALSNAKAEAVPSQVSTNSTNTKQNELLSSTFIGAFVTSVIETTFAKIGIQGFASMASLVGASIGTLCVSIFFAISSSCYVNRRVNRRIDAHFDLRSVTNKNHRLFKSSEQQPQSNQQQHFQQTDQLDNNANLFEHMSNNDKQNNFFD